MVRWTVLMIPPSDPNDDILLRLTTFIYFCLYFAVLHLPATQSQLIVNPKPFLADLTGKNVRVRLKWGQEYQGRLASSDAYMNLQLEDTEEFIDGHFAGALGEVLIRCNNVLYIKAADLKGGRSAMDEQF
jgi:small nuclear ribonucleoprotein F